MKETTTQLTLPLLAGVNDESEPIFESVRVTVCEDPPNTFQLEQSPAFVRGLAAGDQIKFIDESQLEFEVVQRSGNLCIRVFRKENIDEIENFLTPQFEKMEGQLDRKMDRELVYTIHVSIGFQMIESLLDQSTAAYHDSVWYYGNVYSPEDGVTPLGWWDEILAQT